MNNVTTANTLANQIANVSTESKGLGFHSFTAEMHKVLMPLIMEADLALPEGQELTPRDIAELTFHPTVLEVMTRIDRQLYKSEFIAAFKQQMEEMGLKGVEGAQSLIDQANSVMIEFAGKDILDRSMSVLDGLGYECHAAILASFTH